MAIVPQIRAYLGRVELELAQVGSQMADGMELVEIYVPVRALPASNLDGQVIVDGLYPDHGVALDFELVASERVTSVNGHEVTNSIGAVTRISVPPTIPKQGATASYRLRVENSKEGIYNFVFNCLSPDVWQGSLVVDNAPAGQPPAPSDKRPDGRNDRVGANALLLPFLDHLLRGDFEAAYQLCASEYRSIVPLEEFRVGVPRYASRPIHQSKAHSGADPLRVSCVVTETVYGDDDPEADQSGFNSFFTVAPTPEGYAILDFHLHPFQRRRTQDDSGPDYPLLV